MRVPLLLCLSVLLCVIPIPASGSSEPVSAPSDVVWVVPIKGVISPASSQLLLTTLEQARETEIQLLIVAMDTPGGLDTSMREMIQGILASPVAVVAYVSPQGARAASAGTFLMYASHVAAMAPATNLGAATPVALSPSGPADSKPEQAEDQAPDNAQSLRNKAVNDAVAYIRSLAELRGRNADWGESAVRQGASLSANEALEAGVIDLMAVDVADLLVQLDGRRVTLASGEQTLTTSQAQVIYKDPGWRYRLLATLTNPNVALLLMMLGFYGLVLEFYSPGVGLPSVVGSVCLLLGLYALNLLPVNLAGAALMVLGIALMVAEAFAPSFGLFGIGGIAAFVAGAVLLMDTDVPEFQLALPLISALAVVSALFTAVVIKMALASRSVATVTGIDTLIARRVLIDARYLDSGMVELNGEVWYARANEPLAEGQWARVEAIDGLTLVLHPEETDDDC
ncbi:membrane-bound serine protease (ClpP class) [Ferrimonas sediminum]|uniref:Membrane-bound serine protease (ClpP class) n=1 Tax=Ferrimonas sediminum TaxID=718193 RepID=A0A1G9B7Z8_9GAMM|nr:nodulation protein NfeD [Ferrimonas sediminum]SDK35598.1 membrane-bound serine protease (ClpP class) [Ferrimonas sediminum]